MTLIIKIEVQMNQGHLKSTHSKFKTHAKRLGFKKEIDKIITLTKMNTIKDKQINLNQFGKILIILLSFVKPMR